MATEFLLYFQSINMEIPYLKNSHTILIQSIVILLNPCISKDIIYNIHLIAGSISFLNISSYFAAFKFPSMKNESIKVFMR